MNTNRRLLISGLSVVVLLTIGFLGLEEIDKPNPFPPNSDMTPGLIRSQDVIDSKIHRKEMKLAGEASNGPKNPRDRAAWEYEMRTGSDGTIPHGALMRAKNQFDQLAKQQPVIHDKDGGIQGWEWLGPGNIGGRIRAIAIHPTNHNTIWIGGVSGGIWKTIDGGDSWFPLADFMANLAVTFIVLDPNHPTTLYASTGEGVLAHAGLL